MPVCSHRSATLAFYIVIEEKNIGEHLPVSSLIAGSFNQRLPQPRYTFIWDIQLVIDYLKIYQTMKN